jgi:hypothetical protein
MSSCSIFIRPIEPRKDTATADYLALLTMFPDNQPGAGAEPYYFTEIREQPMTYGLFLSSEALHFKSFPNYGSLKRIRKAAEWLLNNADADNDGRLGWGLPQEWDAFGDGSINPANHPYTITTAIVLNALLDALSIRPIWTDAERQAIRNVIIKVALRWCQEAWTSNNSEGFFWYSPSPDDAHFVPNVSSMFLGSLVRVFKEQKKAIPKADRPLIQNRIIEAARCLISRMSWHSGTPFWKYIEWESSLNQDYGPNDLVHHCYLLWGMEVFRSFKSNIRLPWTRKQAIKSLDVFWKGETIYNYPQNLTYEADLNSVINQPAILWGAGMMMAFYGKWGDSVRKNQCLNYINNTYGPIPNLRLWPQSFSNDGVFYARYAAHVLFGIAIWDFFR